jgi:RecB family exonuclease
MNADIAFGHSIHKTLEKFHSAQSGDLEELMLCYDDSWRNEGFKDAAQCFQYYLRGKKILENYFETFLQSKAKVLYTEKTFDANIGKYRFIGIIDRIDKYPDGSYEIIDYKTHVKIWTKEKVDSDLQLSFYAYACKNVLGLTPDKISVYFISSNQKIYTKRSAEQIRQAIDLALETAEKISAEDFTPLCAQCQFCDFKTLCRHSIYHKPCGNFNLEIKK